jgi:hypothetical protein
MNSGLTSGLASAPLRTPIARRTNGQGVVVGSGTATGNGSFALGGTATGIGSFSAAGARATNTRSFAYGLNANATGLNSVNFGGSNNTSANGSGSFVAACNNNSTVNTNGSHSVCLSSEYSTVSAPYTTILSGSYCVASGPNSLSQGFSSNASGFCSVAFGKASSATSFSFGQGLSVACTRWGQKAFGSGVWTGVDSSGTNGGAQFNIFTLRGRTLSNTETELFLNLTTQRLTIASGYALYLIVEILGVKSDGTSAACYTRKAAIKNVDGTTSFISDVQTIGTDEPSGTSIAITADDTDDSLKVTATGIESETWRWLASVYGSQIEYGT